MTRSTVCAITVCLVRSRYTGKERDTESGNDYFKYRYLASSMGRWLSPDPSGLTHVDLGNPQELNLYSYVGNNPLTRVDLDGLCIKGFQWACNLGQIIDNGFHGLGWQTDAGVEREQHRDNTALRGAGVETEGLSQKQVRKLYNGVMAGGIGGLRTGRPSAAQARAIWEKATGGKVPFDPKYQRFYDMQHNTPIADGGDPTDPANLRPMQHDDHVAEHSKNGDWQRWSLRSRADAVRNCNCDSPEDFQPPPGFDPAVPTEPIGPVEEPPIIIPE